MHRLTAGAGYRYLLRQIATGDCRRTGANPVAAYYTESGNPPGRWIGRGLAGLGSSTASELAPGILEGAKVEEEAMARLFGHGHDPMTDVPLGRPYPHVPSATDRVAAATKMLPPDMTHEARATAVEKIMRIELAKDTGTAVAGFDLTFTVMKSVSTLWAVSDPKVQQVILDAHTAAVAQSMRLLEERGLFTRTGSGGCRQEPTSGAIAAAFDHWDSRAGDPNLHTHMVLANKVQTLDGRWMTVDSRALHHALVAISETYETFLVDELARRLPVRWGWRGRPRRPPALELDGVDAELMAAFSQRASQIDEAMTTVIAAFAATHGRGPNRIEITRLRQQVTRATRPDKKIVPLGDLLARWRRRASEISGLTPEQLTTRVLQGSRVRPVRVSDVPKAVVDELAARVLEGVRERRSTWTRWNVAAETARVTKALIATSPQDRMAILDAITDAVMARCVSLEAPEVFVATGRYARSDGGSVFDRPGEHAYTDQVILDAEQRLLAAASSDTAPTAPAPDEALAFPDDKAAVLADDQADAVRTIASSGRLVDLLVGPAGSGKTTTLAALRRVWERQYGRGAVIGLAPSSTAAANLAGALGITCENTAKWLRESTGPGAIQRAAILEQLRAMRATRYPSDVVGMRTIDTAVQAFGAQGARWTLRAGQLMVVDEASLAGTLALDELTRQAAQAGAKLLLVGDHAQLSAVDAGGAFGLLVDRTGGAQLRTLWRFTQAWEADATAALRAGSPRVLETYEDAERVHAGPGESMLEEAYSAWTADVAAGYTAVLLAPDAGTVAALNSRAHNDRVQDGLVEPEGLTTRLGAKIGVGDRIVTRLNDRHLTRPGGFVRNGDLWDVHAIGADGSLLVVPARTRLARRGLVGTPGSDEHAPVVLPGEYAHANVELAYATTTHRAQGITVDRAHVLAHAGMTRENLYVAMTRGRDANHVYVAVDRIDADCDDLPDPHAAFGARDILATILATTGAEQSATATIAANQDEAGSLRRLEPIARTLYADAAQQRWTDALARVGVSPGMIGTITASPDAGRVFAWLDRVAIVAASRRDVVVRGLVDGLVGRDATADQLLSGALRWLRGCIADVHDLPTTHDATGLDADGWALLDEINQLMDDRVSALTASTQYERPDWLDRLGPEPTNPTARQAWLDEIAATVAHHDRIAATPAPATTVSTPSLSR